nr:hypothetical protein [Tanacetum cinerariifolium]
MVEEKGLFYANELLYDRVVEAEGASAILIIKNQKVREVYNNCDAASIHSGGAACFTQISKLHEKGMAQVAICLAWTLSFSFIVADKSYEHDNGFVFADISIGADIQMYDGIASWVENLRRVLRH